MKFSLGESFVSLDSRMKKVMVNPSVDFFTSTLENLDPSVGIEELLRFLGCDLAFLEEFKEGCDPQTNLLSQLSAKAESEIQAELRKAWCKSGDSYCCAIDTSTSNHNAPFYSSPDSATDATSSSSGSTSSAGPHRNAGKPDFASLALCMTLEMKGFSVEGSKKARGCTLPESAYETLYQATERVWMSNNQNELLRRVFSFATMGSLSWLICCERKYAPFGEGYPGASVLEETLRIIPIDTSMIIPVWRAVTKAALDDPIYFLHRDMFILRDILSEMKLNIAYCRVSILAVSDATVYAIFPHLISGKSSMELGKKPAFAIKVHRDPFRGHNELAALKLLQGCQHAAKYVLATFEYTGEGSEFQMTDFLASRTQPAIDSSSAAPTPSGLKYNLMMFSESQGVVFSLDRVKDGYKCTLMTENRRLSHPWWEFAQSPPAAQSSTRSAEESMPKRAKMVTDQPIRNRPRTAVVMRVGSKELKWESKFKGGLLKQIGEMHSKNVFHTDMRRANILGFDFSRNVSVPDESKGSNVEFCIIDFDCAVFVESAEPVTEVVLDISREGGRKDLILESVDPDKVTNHGSTVSVQWNVSDERDMLTNTIGQLSSPSLNSTSRDLSTSGGRSYSLLLDMQSEH